jgi:hypothetical protein
MVAPDRLASKQPLEVKPKGNQFTWMVTFLGRERKGIMLRLISLTFILLMVSFMRCHQGDCIKRK